MDGRNESLHLKIKPSYQHAKTWDHMRTGFVAAT